jgi:hypothetical protein
MCRNALELAPEYSSAHTNLAAALVHGDELEPALREFEWVAKRLPTDRQAAKNVAVVKARLAQQRQQAAVAKEREPHLEQKQQTKKRKGRKLTSSGSPSSSTTTTTTTTTTTATAATTSKKESSENVRTVPAQPGKAEPSSPKRASSSGQQQTAQTAEPAAAEAAPPRQHTSDEAPAWVTLDAWVGSPVYQRLRATRETQAHWASAWKVTEVTGAPPPKPTTAEEGGGGGGGGISVLVWAGGVRGGGGGLMGRQQLVARLESAERACVRWGACDAVYRRR